MIFALVFLGILPGLQNKQANPANVKATLNFWGIGDSPSVYDPLIQSFNKTYKNVTINYRGFNGVRSYESAVLNALAAGQGPDIFMIPNTGLAAEIDKITPVPATLFTPLNLQQTFPPVVAQDMVAQNQIYGLPLSIDTLALIYNRSLFDAAGVPLPSTWQSWNDFVKYVPQLVKKDADGNITQAAAAIGGASNINDASDILTLLFMQNGVPLDARGGNLGLNTQAGQSALNFYAQFASPNSADYTWNASLPDSLTAFAQGKTAMVFDYASALPQIQSQNQLLKAETALMPQPQGGTPVAYPRYWAYTVSKQSPNAALAWQFILNMTTNAQNAAGYVSATGKPPALNAVIYNYESDPVLSPFARQALIARSWYQADPAGIAQALATAIQSVVAGSSTASAALNQTEYQIYGLPLNEY
ncbi:MAG: extracellular solute-binding protein [Chloroflexi bacterium]|nr:extracellular solute-binding protein [Chloroflexota bacterium]